LLTHAHIDHCGLIPKLYKQGFSGKIYATSATIDLCEIMFEDSANIQEKNIEEENKRRKKQHLPPRFPIYTVEEAVACMKLFTPIENSKTFSLNENIQAKFNDAGHIL
jgi:metallo-beta-lactamase family protein